jgi:hypothetical protein
MPNAENTSTFDIASTFDIRHSKLTGIAKMPIRKYKPTSPGRRFQTVQTFDDITTTEPHKPLVEPLKRSGGRDNHGELTSWWRGGGH